MDLSVRLRRNQRNALEHGPARGHFIRSSVRATSAARPPSKRAGRPDPWKYYASITKAMWSAVAAPKS